jgi:lysozyme
MKTSDKGIHALVQHEGVVPAPYLDSVGVLTYGVGHTKAAGSPNPADLPKGMPEDLDKALTDVFQVFKTDLAKYEAAVDKAITVPVTQYQFDAAVSFHYNTGAISSATWVKTLNSGDTLLAAEQIMNWTKPSEIIPRRQAEQDLFKSGTYPNGDVIVWKVSDDYKMIWNPECTLSSSEVLGYLGLDDNNNNNNKEKGSETSSSSVSCPTCKGSGVVSSRRRSKRN